MAKTFDDLVENPIFRERHQRRFHITLKNVRMSYTDGNGTPVEYRSATLTYCTASLDNARLLAETALREKRAQEARILVSKTQATHRQTRGTRQWLPPFPEET